MRVTVDVLFHFRRKERTRTPVPTPTPNVVLKVVCEHMYAFAGRAGLLYNR